MRHKSLLGLTAVALAALGTTAAAQSTASSESGVLVASGVMATGGNSVSGSGGQWAGSGGQPLAGVTANSDNYSLHSGVVWQPAAIGTDVPMVFGVRPGFGTKDGGTSVSVFGYNFQAAGAGFPLVELAGTPGAGTAIAGNTELTMTTPAGLSSLQNPIANAAVYVSNNNGDDETADAYDYLPAMEAATAHAILGSQFKLRTMGTPGGLYTVVFGLNVPDTGVSVFPYSGQLEVLLAINFLVGFVPFPTTGISTLPLPLPDDPALSGISISFQALAFDDFSLATGSFSNRLGVTFL